MGVSCRGMLRNNHRIAWRGRATTAGVLFLALVGGACAPSGVLTPPVAPAADTSPSLSQKVSNFFSGASAKSPQAVAGAQPSVNCPSLEIREGASTLVIGPGGQNATMSLKYQGSFARLARECAVVGADMVMKIGVEGRIIIGPAGGPGQVDVPLRIAVVQETPGGARPVTTKFVRIPVAVTAQGAFFTHIEEGLSFPLPTPTTALDDYTAYVGFDPLSAEAQDQQKQKPQLKPRHHKPAASAN